MTTIEGMFASMLRPIINIIAFTPTEEILVSSAFMNDTTTDKEIRFN